MDPRQNTDRELWREPDTTSNGDFYSDSIHVTASGGIGINCAGHVVVMPLRKWHALALASLVPPPSADATNVEEPPLTEGEQDELDRMLAWVLLPSFTDREREIARASARAALRNREQHGERQERAYSSAEELEQLLPIADTHGWASVVREAIDILRALPPHEGETPQDIEMHPRYRQQFDRAEAWMRRANELERLIGDLQSWAKECGWQDVDEPIAALLDLTYVPPAPRGETPQPAAEQVWLVIQRDDVCGGSRGVFRCRADAEEAIADIRAEHPDLPRGDFIIQRETVRPLPPVVQTRPED